MLDGGGSPRRSASSRRYGARARPARERRSGAPCYRPTRTRGALRAGVRPGSGSRDARWRETRHRSGRARLSLSPTPSHAGAHHRKVRGQPLAASRKAARASRSVESRVGRGELPGSTSRGISVQARATASQSEPETAGTTPRITTISRVKHLDPVADWVDGDPRMDRVAVYRRAKRFRSAATSGSAGRWREPARTRDVITGERTRMGSAQKASGDWPPFRPD